MANPIRTDEEVKEIARDLLAEGRLSLERLRERAGGGGTRRILRLKTEVEREARPVAPEGSAEGAATTEEKTVVPREIADALNGVAQLVATALHRARQEEGDRARTAEETLRTQHAEQVAERQREYDRLAADNEELADALDDRDAQIEQANATIAELREHAREQERRVHALQEQHSRERAELQETIGSTHADLQAAQQAQREAEVARAEIAQELRDVRAALEQAQSGRDEALRQVEAMRAESRAALENANAARERAEQERDAAREEATRLREQVASLSERLDAAQQISGINEHLSILIERLPEQQKPAKRKGAK